VGKQKASEWQRARHLRLELKQHGILGLSTKDIVVWCRKAGHTPSDENLATVQKVVVLYCKYCGLSHPSEHFHDMQEACKGRLSQVKQDTKSGSAQVLTNGMQATRIQSLSNLFTRVGNEQDVDWIKQFLATLKVPLRDTSEQRPDVMLLTVRHMIVYLMALKAMELFGRSLIQQTLRVYAAENGAQKQRDPMNRVLAPGHVLAAIASQGNFDFLK
jgi:hypothetical protein